MSKDIYDEMVDRLVKVQADARFLAVSLTNQNQDTFGPGAERQAAQEAERIQDELAQIAQALVGLEWPGPVPFEESFDAIIEHERQHMLHGRPNKYHAWRRAKHAFHTLPASPVGVAQDASSNETVTHERFGELPLLIEDWPEMMQDELRARYRDALSKVPPGSAFPGEAITATYVSSGMEPERPPSPDSFPIWTTRREEEE